MILFSITLSEVKCYSFLFHCVLRLGALLGMISKSSFGDSGFLVAFIFHVTKCLESCWIPAKKQNYSLKDNVIGT